ncbi:type II toxin-antitoxin system RelE family toxin [Zymomonas mobilis]|uniref:Plasmid stabilization system n=1 Tax=Zymomonas mobilis subsp. mobilis (strain ATCC 10988 / DSM 424 / LMG 404 / NCIMB 8938 / NRRL B-806 / ZM1) TaxID=555217 RepID=A0A0H3G4U5_ZYMMA|nr:type II toxin-antitoxin system RelE/ParE family toxin [Zymomonas mobilis]AEH63640.1 plasmid stabilization system [Zymomonas mobilis subsp. mobilis ATCC 10988]TQL24935.1 mRNA interferase RelE/StbE [Zymomonas mobilis]
MNSCNDTTYDVHYYNGNAEKCWKKLPQDVKKRFAKQIEKVCRNPALAKPLSGDLAGFYKLKLQSPAYRVVYQLDTSQHKLIIIAVGVRNNGKIYDIAAKKLE